MSNRFDTVLDHGAVDDMVDGQVIKTQLATAQALRKRLDEYGGVILGDEVGAGKTYVTFALIAEALAADPSKGVVIFVPSQLLKAKWCEQLQDYLRAALHDQRLAERLIKRITPINRSLRDDGTLNKDHWGRKPAKNAIVVATHNVYSYRTSKADQAACLRAAAQKLDIGVTIRPTALLRACDVPPSTDVEWADWAWSEDLTASVLQPLKSVLQRYANGERGLGSDSRQAAQEIRRRVGRASLPNAALVVIDEAHNLKSTESAIYQSLMSVLSARFDALLFLTATPFQLGRDELLNVVNFFRFARTYEGREAEFDRRVEAMSLAMDGWIQALDWFGGAWRDLDREQAQQCAELLQGEGRDELPADDLVRRAIVSFDQCLVAKKQLERGMRPFVVRSVRTRHHEEHAGVTDDYVSEDSRVPLALVDRLLVELMQHGRTFISSALITACSSWEALDHAAIMRDEDRESHTRLVLRRMFERNLPGDHPKVAYTIAQCLQGLDAGEKTLVFVERDQTGAMLRDTIERQVEQATEHGSDAPTDKALRERLQTKTRFGWPSLRENYLHTVYPLVFAGDPSARDVRAAWADPAVQELWGRVDAESEKRDYSVEKRFWEHVLFARAARSEPGWQRAAVKQPALVETVKRLLEPDYVLNGLDLRSGSGERVGVPPKPQREKPREPNLAFADAYVRYASPWVIGRSALSTVPPDDRAEFVDAAASAIAASHFRQELGALEIESDPGAHFDAVGAHLANPVTNWPTRFAALSEQAGEAVKTSNETLAHERIQGLIEALGSNVRIQYISGSTATQTQQNAVAGFNTPLYPEVIVCTPVLAEGLDLHRFCRRVVHHDLPWNPAKLEQRTGRVDRVGSLSERLARDGRLGADAWINVWLPFVPGTYDEFIFERVMARRREFRCILGNKPEWREEVLGEDEHGTPIDEQLVRRLQVDLGPRVR